MLAIAARGTASGEASAVAVAAGSHLACRVLPMADAVAGLGRGDSY